MMNPQETNRISNTPPTNDADDFLVFLYAHDVLSAIFKPEECKMKIVKLGITIPIVKDKCLLFGRDGQEAIYLFSCDRDPNRDNENLRITGFRFDIEQYRRRPFTGIPEVSDAFRHCASAVAQLEGFDPTKCVLKTGSQTLN